MNLLKSLRQTIKNLIVGRKVEIPEPAVPVSRTYTIDVQKHSKITAPKLDSSRIIEMIRAQSDLLPLEVPFEDAAKLTEFEKKYRTPLYQYLLKRIKRAITADQASVQIFQFGKSDKTAILKKSEYEPQLHKILDWCVKEEDYESAGACRDLIRQLKNNVID